jgi:hypothetical protein
MSNLPPLHWDLCLECNAVLSDQQIADDDSICQTCLEEING